MGDVRADLERAGHEVPVVSAGSSLTARYLSAADGITEIRPGTYIYNDLRTLACWSCTSGRDRRDHAGHGGQRRRTSGSTSTPGTRR